MEWCEERKDFSPFSARFNFYIGYNIKTKQVPENVTHLQIVFLEITLLNSALPVPQTFPHGQENRIVRGPLPLVDSDAPPKTPCFFGTVDAEPPLMFEMLDLSSRHGISSAGSPPQNSHLILERVHSPVF